MKKPKVSIFCLCYNQSKFIRESLKSIKDQTYKDYELLIIDDCSKDDSCLVIDEWLKENSDIDVTFIKHEENKGICKSLNELLYISKGEYIQMLALDDLLLEEKLEKQVAILDSSRENECLVFSDAFLIDDNSDLYQNRFIAYHKKYLSINTDNFYDNLIDGNFIPGMSVLLKKKFVVNNGGWDENLNFEDYDMWLRLSKANLNFIFDEYVSCKYRLHNNNTHKNNRLMGDETFNIFIKHIENSIARERIEYDLERNYMHGGDNERAKYFYSLVPPEKFSKIFIKNGWSKFIFRILNKLNL